MRQHAFIFPGQGSQYVGMGKDLTDYSVAMQTYDEADAALGFSLKDICWNGPEDKLKETAVTQPAILTTSIAVYRVLLEKGFSPSYVAGHSLGEYSALVAAGVLALSDAVRIVRKRGELMQTAVPLGVGKMSAVLGLSREKVEQACLTASEVGIVEPANYNCPGQVVIGGEALAVEAAAALCKQAGAKKTIELLVSAPFHTSLMRKAGEGLEEFIKDIEFKKPVVPFISNVDARVIDDPITIKASLVKQVSSKIFWEDCINVIVDMGCNSFVEVGPGKVLSGFVKKIAKDARVCNAGDAASLAKINECLGE